MMQSGIYTSGPLFDYAVELHSLAQLCIVLNDGQYGSGQHGMQALGYDPPDTTFPLVDFAAFAQAQGAYGRRVDDETQCAAALVDVIIDPNRRSPLLSRICTLQARCAKRSEKDSAP